MPLREQHPGLFRKLRIMGDREMYCGLAVFFTLPADVVPGGLPRELVGVLLFLLGIVEYVGAYRTRTSDSRQVFRLEQLPIYTAAVIWSVWAVWSAWSYLYHHQIHHIPGGVRSMFGVGLFFFNARDAYNVAREPVRRFGDTT